MSVQDSVGDTAVISETAEEELLKESEMSTIRGATTQLTHQIDSEMAESESRPLERKDCLFELDHAQCMIKRAGSTQTAAPQSVSDAN